MERPESMSPLYHLGDELEVIRTPVDRIRPGDVVVFRPKRRAKRDISHRCVAVRRDADGTFLRTKGDNLRCLDPVEVTAEMYQGRVAAVTRMERRFVLQGRRCRLAARALAGVSRLEGEYTGWRRTRPKGLRVQVHDRVAASGLQWLLRSLRRSVRALLSQPV